MFRFKNSHVGLAVLQLLLWLTVNAAVRALLFLAAGASLQGTDGLERVRLFMYVAFGGLLPYLSALLPLLPALLPRERLRGRTGRTAAALLFWLYACLFLFGSVVEALLLGNSGSLPALPVHAATGPESVARSPVMPLLSAVAGFAALFCLFLLRRFRKRAMRRLVKRPPFAQPPLRRAFPPREPEHPERATPQATLPHPTLP